jgi:hypothetical protein
MGNQSSKHSNVFEAVWSTIHHLVLLLAFGLILKWNATVFDATEINSLIQAALAMAGIVGVKALVLSKTSRNNNGNQTTPP